jgi:hypothetical protein
MTAARKRTPPPIQDTPPHDANAEMAVVSTMILYPEQAMPICTEAGLRKEMFYIPAHRTVFEELLDVWDSGRKIELIDFTERLRRNGTLEAIGGAAAITDISIFADKLHSFAALPDLNFRIELLQAAYVRRQIIVGAAQDARRAYDPNPNADMAAVLDEIRSRTDSLYSLAKQNGYLTPVSWEELQKAPDERDSLLEKRALEKGQGALVFGPSGCGKSTLGFQMCVCWSAGIAGTHIAPPRPLKIVILQTEDSLNDLREYRKGIFAGGNFAPEQIELIKKNLVILPPIPGGSPEHLGKLLDQAAMKFRPDIISLNPLLAFCPRDPTKELGAILYQVVDPIIKRRGVGFVGVHHTPKLIYNKPTGLSAYDYQYLAAGDARVANWPRLSLQIEPLAVNPVLVVCFRITKRWQRIPWVNDFGEPTTERYIKHSADKIWWCDASKDEAEAAREHEEPRKILDVLPEPSEPGILREEIRVRAKNQLKIGKHKADEWLNIVLHDGMAERYEDSTASKRKVALFRRVYA